MNLYVKLKPLQKVHLTRGVSMRQQAVNVDHYLTAISRLYQQSSKEKKSEILNYAELVTERSRKQLM